MKEEEQQILTTKLEELIKYTTCSYKFLNKLVVLGNISEEEADELSQPGGDGADRARRFYEIIVSGNRGYQKLLSALLETNQVQAADILMTTKLEEKTNSFNLFDLTATFKEKLVLNDSNGNDSNGSTKVNISKDTKNDDNGFDKMANLLLSLDEAKLLGRGRYDNVVRKVMYDGKHVAVKSISAKLLQMEQATSETGQLISLREHENVLRVFFAKEINYNRFIFGMELCDISLHDWVNQKQPMNYSIEILRQATTGIGFLHDNQITHGNLKPTNILLRSGHGRNIQVKVSDLRPRMKLNFSRSTVTALECDVVGWMAPELLHDFDPRKEYNEVTMTPASDVFSLGCVYYFVMTEGKHPFGSVLRRPGNILENNPIVSLDHVTSVLPSNVCIVISMIHADPMQRPIAESLLSHHTFWSSKKALQFVGLVADASQEKANNINNCIQRLDTYSTYVLGHPSATLNWMKHLDAPLLSQIINNQLQTTNPDSIVDLINIIGLFNSLTLRQAHGIENENSADEILNFWTKTRFPFLIPTIWKCFENIRDDQRLLPFYENFTPHYQAIEAIDSLRISFISIDETTDPCYPMEMDNQTVEKNKSNSLLEKLIDTVNTQQVNENCFRGLLNLYQEPRRKLNELKQLNFFKSFDISFREDLRHSTVDLDWQLEQRIVHRDLKPETCLLLPFTPRRFKISDFGLSRKIKDDRSFVSTSSIGGTQGWVAPEILTEALQGNPRLCRFTSESDIFALGCVYYFVMTDGKHAFGDRIRCQGHILDGKPVLDKSDIVYGCQLALFIKLCIASQNPKWRPGCLQIPNDDFFDDQKLLKANETNSNIAISSFDEKNYNDDLELIIMEKLYQNYKIASQTITAVNLKNDCLKYYSDAMREAITSCDTKKAFTTKHEKVKVEVMGITNAKCSATYKSKKFLKEFMQNQMDWSLPELLCWLDHVFQAEKKTENEITNSVKKKAYGYYYEEMETHMKNNHFINLERLRKIHDQVAQTALQRCTNATALKETQLTILKHSLKKSYKNYEDKINMMLNYEFGSEPAIGIDLGTTYCCVAVFFKGRTIVIRNAQGSNTTASYVCINPDGNHTIGNPAKENAFMQPENTVYDVKRILGRSFADVHLQNDMEFWPFTVVDGDGGPAIQIGQKLYPPEQIASILLRDLVKQAEEMIGIPIKRAVVTVPAYFTDGQRQATKDAADMAGLELLQILDEPTAAALAYKLERFHEDARTVIIYDFGSGTFDVSILELEGGNIKILNKDGDTHLGGEDFDKSMMVYCAGEFKKQHNLDPFEGKDSTQKQDRDAAKQRLRQLQFYCEQGKKQLATSITTTISIDGFFKEKDLRVAVSRTKFEQLNAAHFQKTLEIVDRSLKAVGLAKNQIDDIVLVGGSTRIPKVKEMLSAYFDGKVLNHTIHPDEAVAYGAAVQAALLNGGDAKKELTFGKIEDVTPMSLGVE